MPTVRRSNVHLDILMGRDETLDPPDIFLGMCPRYFMLDMTSRTLRNGAWPVFQCSFGNGEKATHVNIEYCSISKSTFLNLR